MTSSDRLLRRERSVAVPARTVVDVLAHPARLAAAVRGA